MESDYSEIKQKDSNSKSCAEEKKISVRDTSHLWPQTLFQEHGSQFIYCSFDFSKTFEMTKTRIIFLLNSLLSMI